MLWKSSVFSFLLFFSLDSRKHLSVRSDKAGVQRWPCARDPLRRSPWQPRFHSGGRWASRGPAESHGEGPRCLEKRLVLGDASGFETIFSGAAGVLLYCASLLLAFKETKEKKTLPSVSQRRSGPNPSTGSLLRNCKEVFSRIFMLFLSVSLMPLMV